MMQKRQISSGFSLLELTISLALLLIISGAVLGSMMASQKNYRGQQIKTSLDQQMRGALELMSAEIGQAGLPLSRLAGSDTVSTHTDNTLVVRQAAGSIATVITVAGVTTGYTVNINTPTFPFYKDQTIIIDSGGIREQATLSDAIGGTTKTISGTFVNPHGVGDPIFSAGLYPQGVLWFNDTTYTAVAGAPNVYTGYELWMFGDITNQGALDLISYKCQANGASYQLVRTTYPTTQVQAVGCTKPSDVLGTPPPQKIVLLDNVLNCNPALNPAAPPFTFVAIKPNSVPLNTSSYTFVTSVSISLAIQSLTNDLRTKQPVTLTKSLLNIQPRNVLAAYLTPDPSDYQQNPNYGAFACFP